MPWLIVTIFLPLAGVVALLAWPGLDDRRARRLMVAFLFLESTLLGVFLSLDLLLFFLFFEAMLFPMYLIIGGWGGERRASAAIKFFLYTMFGSAFLFVGILFLYFQAGSITG